MSKSKKALVMLSGGIDSSTCLYWAKKKYSDVLAITFNYHGRIENEKRATAKLARRAAVRNLFEINVPFIKEYSDFCTGSTFKNDCDRRLSSYIPARNMIFYSISAHYAEFLKIKWIIGGHNSHDAEFFRDATKGYIKKINSLLRQGRLVSGNEPPVILLPLADMDRQKIIRLALEIDVPLELTWSCHNEGKTHCRECYSCTQRLEAFRCLGIKDPVFS
ncbi:MAG: 7-cyano-7-deazaguanine synthase [Nitrososphaeraceae archaeon]